ncbi:MAG: hypothetical protein B6245_03565 [Desulfobacteraceae bacterium 4572_88]|nr:MAG: hypothetical protein B6245_03565 [Desulfobacteraceae bacterium 4572_88]
MNYFQINTNKSNGLYLYKNPNSAQSEFKKKFSRQELMPDIIIVNYNSTDHLIHCLRSLEKALGRGCAKLYIQDNASADGVDRIADEFPLAFLRINPENLGFARAVNNALKQGQGDYVILLNPDTRVSPGFFESCRVFMEAHPNVGIMGPRILDHDGKLQNSARAFPTPLTALFGRASLFSKWFPNNPVTSRNLLSLRSDGRTPMPVDWVSGACMVVRRKAIDEVSGLDERFFMYWEDADWCRRMWAARWQVVYFPGAWLHHYVGGSSEKQAFRSALEFHKSAYLLFSKYAPPPLSFLKPLVLGGLSVRLFALFTLKFLQWLLGKNSHKNKCV